MTTCFVVTCYVLDFCGRIEIRVCGVFSTETAAEQYKYENKGAQPDEICHEIHEVEYTQ